MKRTSNFKTVLSGIGRSGAIRCGLLAAALAAGAWAGTFGKVVAIGGNASDIVLDEPRGVLYIANFTANRIEVMNTSDLTISRSINVSPQPGAMALSPDGRYLVITHYGNFTAPVAQSNGLTVINLVTNNRDVYTLGFPPLGVAFGNDGQALILTTNDFLLFDPASGGLRALETVSGVIAKTLPVPSNTFPPNITTGSLAASGNGFFIHGLTDQIQFYYDVQNKVVTGYGYTSTPTMGPRVVSVSRDGYLVAAGWAVTDIHRKATLRVPESGRRAEHRHARDRFVEQHDLRADSRAARSAAGACLDDILPSGRKMRHGHRSAVGHRAGEAADVSDRRCGQSDCSRAASAQGEPGWTVGPERRRRHDVFDLR